MYLLIMPTSNWYLKFAKKRFLGISRVPALTIENIRLIFSSQDWALAECRTTRKLEINTINSSRIQAEKSFKPDCMLIVFGFFKDFSKKTKNLENYFFDVFLSTARWPWLNKNFCQKILKLESFKMFFCLSRYDYFLVRNSLSKITKNFINAIGR